MINKDSSRTKTKTISAIPTHDQLSMLTQSLYRSSMNDNFLNPFFEELRECCQLRSAVAVLLDLRTLNFKSIWESGNNQGESDLTIQNQLYKKDPLFQLVMSAPKDQFYATNLDIPEWRKTVDRSILDWSKLTGISEACGASIQIDNNQALTVFLQRGEQDPSFSIQEREQFNNLIPHFREALLLHQGKVEQQTNQVQGDAIIEVFPIPAFILNKHFEVSSHNSKADRWLKSTNKVSLKNKQLSLKDANQRNLLALQVSKIFALNSKYVRDHFFKWEMGSENWAFTLKPIVEKTQDAQKVLYVLCFVHQEGYSLQPSIWALSQIYSLTEREGDICKELLKGNDLPATAETLGISIHTVRDMLKKRIFKKCQCHSQNELIAKLLSNPAAYTAEIM